MKTALITSLHYQPIAGSFDYFDIGTKTAYFTANEFANGLKDYKKECIEPFLLALETDKDLKVTLHLSVPLIDQLDNATLSRFKALGKSRQVEFLGGAGFDSLSVIFSKKLFEEEVKLFAAQLKKKLGASPKGFMNTAMLYSEDIGKIISKSKFSYAIAPRIPWFLKDQDGSVYRSKSGELILVLPELAQSREQQKVSVVMESNPHDLAKYKGNQALVSELTNDTNLPIYHLPDLVANDQKGQGIESLVGNNLQRDFLSRLSEICKLLTESSNESIVRDLLFIGSKAHFSQLSNQIEVELRYKNYTTLLNILYDLEVRLR